MVTAHPEGLLYPPGTAGHRRLFDVV